MCATLQRLNQPQPPDGDENLRQQLASWANQSAQEAQPGRQSGTKTGPGGSPFAIPNGPSPADIPGFPAPPGGNGAAAMPRNPQAGAGIQPLPGMGGGNAAPRAPQGAPGSPAAPGTAAGRINLSMLAGTSATTDQLSTGYLDPFVAWFPEPRTMAETGLNQGLIADLIIKTMYYTSYMSGQEISAALRLPFYGVIDQVISLMKKEQLCDVSGTSGLGEAGYQYLLTAKGMERAHQVLTRSSYVGPAPVPLSRYIEAIKLLTANKPTITKDTVERAVKGMVLSEEMKNQIGAAVNAGRSLFLFGAPGNGKTLLAERIATMLGGNIAVPYSLEADGQVIQLFDLNSHRPVVPKGVSELDPTKAELPDRRWVRIYRPVVVVGGELTLSSLDLIYNEVGCFYEAPFQLKANGGLFLVDDFGRQQISPQALLNRWIVPLEKSIDFLTLKTGKKLQLPFEMFLVLSTNLKPEDLVDDAFLRRIQNKMNVPDPTLEQFQEILIAQCKAMNIPFDPNGFNYLVEKHYKEIGRPFRSAHPRDLLRQLMGLARYLNIQPELTPYLLDAACRSYFVSVKK